MQLYDYLGRPIDTGLLKDEQAAPQLAGIRNVYPQYYPSSNLTPWKLVSILRRTDYGEPWEYLELAEEMEEKDLHYLAVLGTRKESVAQLELIIKPADNSADSLKHADYVREKLLDGPLNLSDALFDMLDAIGKGFSATEIIWDQGAEWTPTRLIWRDPRWFQFDWISGNQLLVRSIEGQQIPAAPDTIDPNFFAPTGAPAGSMGARVGIQPMTTPLAPWKFITHIAKAKSGLPIRGGLARAIAWAYLFKHLVLKDWVTFTEVYGQPLRVGKYGPGATENDKNLLLQAVANIGTDSAAIIPDSMLIEFTELKNSGAGNDIYERFLLYLNDQITLATLGQTLTTQMPREGGSRAAAQVHQAVRRDILASDAQRLSSTINRDLVRPLVDFKFGPQKVYPQLSIGLPDDQDIKTFADAISELADRGLEVDQRTILDKLGLPEPEEGAKLLQPNTQLTGDDPDAPPEDDSDDSNKDAQRKNASTGKTSKQAAQKKTSVPRRRNWQQY
ncbi:MAG TPA: DUF935 domain-containing protein [Candidatus Binataceae bacterium]|nr:DUF935 domain-containing protein [Candidatus Binataceae bacterium]